MRHSPEIGKNSGHLVRRASSSLDNGGPPQRSHKEEGDSMFKSDGAAAIIRGWDGDEDP